MMRFAFVFVVVGLLLFPSQSWAQCETPDGATSRYNQLVKQITDDINKFILQEGNFIDQKITDNSTREFKARMTEFDNNIRNGMSTWWREHYLPAMKQMTAQLYASRVDQTRQIGGLMDAQAVNETLAEKTRLEAEARARYEPGEGACQVDSVGPGAIKAELTATAYNEAVAAEDLKRRTASVGTVAARGGAAEQNRSFIEYVTYFCDPARGDQGCAKPGLRPGANTDIPGLLWGNKKTIDMSDANNLVIVPAALRTMLSLRVADPVPASVVNTPQGQQAMLERRSYEARTNAVQNVMGQMVAQRIGGSGVDTRNMRTAAGQNAAYASNNASYAEIREAMTRDRFHNPQYAIDLVNNPAVLVREQGAINAIRLQQLNDMYKRMEEMVVMEAAIFAADLDRQKPASLGGAKTR